MPVMEKMAMDGSIISWLSGLQAELFLLIQTLSPHLTPRSAIELHTNRANPGRRTDTAQKQPC